jgi:murein DD-endopeptidase MepM/ murein hydrolase activator NlpD
VAVLCIVFGVGMIASARWPTGQATQTTTYSALAGGSLAQASTGADQDDAPTPLPAELAPVGPPESGDVIQRNFVLSGAPMQAQTPSNSLERSGILTYTVHEGDTVFGIALTFGLTPETVLWTNYKSLRDNPDLLSIGQQLLIPPMNGLVVEVEMGDTVDGLARLFKVQPDVIVNEPINGLTSVNDLLPLGKTLFVPGGERELVVWQLPEPVEVGTKSVQTARGVVNAKVYNVGNCGNVAIPALGTGSLVYPTGSSYVSGYNFRGTHGGIDFGGKMNIPIFAADSGTVVFAGDSVNAAGRFVGYGRYLVLDHGNGLRTLYAHNSSLTVSCGQQVSKGEVIAQMGSTGRSTGPHSHFEVRSSSGYVNPWTLLSPQ